MDIPSNKPEAAGTPANDSGHRQRIRQRRRRVPRAVRTNYLLHILFYDGRFRWALVACGTVFVVLGLLVPKIWITSPPGFVPAVKVSGLDLLQARSLRKLAVSAEQGGRLTEAIQTWVSAIANDPANPESVRGLIRSLARQPVPDRAWLPEGLQESDTLLRLTHTNAADLETVAEFYARYGQHGWTISRLGATNAPATVATTAALLRSLFLSGQMERLAEVWKQRETLAAASPESALYHAAWQAGWGPAFESVAGRERLEGALKDAALRPLALSLLLRLHYKTLDLRAYEQRLAELDDLHAATLRDQMEHWVLLDLAGQRAQAVALARSFVAAPQTAEEAEQLLSTWARLELFEEGAQLARRLLGDFGPVPALWVRAGQFLIEGKRWDDLRAQAIELRQTETLLPVLGEYGWFLEGVADHGLGRRDAAAAAFGQFLGQLPKDPAVTLHAAVTLGRLGYAEAAAALFKHLDTVTGNNLAFWTQAQLMAYENRQAELLLASCEKIHQIRPDDASAANLAAALLTVRENPDEAVRLTEQVAGHSPRSLAARLNHALALVQDERPVEAEALLRTVPATGLEESARTMLSFAWFQCHRVAGRFAAARAAAALVDVRFLFPPQLKWFERAQAEMPPG